MGIREKLNKNPSLTTGATIAIILIALIAIIVQLVGTHGAGHASNKGYFTIDDGKSYFIDDARKIPPYDYKGKPAYRAVVFKCGGTKFIGFLVRYDEDSKAKLEEALSTNDHDTLAKAAQIGHAGEEVKKPLTGDDGWVKLSDPKAPGIMQVKCPDDSDELPVAVQP